MRMQTRSSGKVPAGKRTRNRTRPHPYATNDDATGTDTFSEDEDSLYSDERRSENRCRATSLYSSVKKRKTVATRQPRAGNKKSRQDHHKRRRRKSDQPRVTVNGKPAPWHTLPYHVLVQVFHHVGYPLVDDYLNPTPSMGHLSRMARVCKAFAEPALSALYYSPPLLPPSRAYNLLVHLQSQNEESMYNYRSKIKYLVRIPYAFRYITNSSSY